MKAAIVKELGKMPVYADFQAPVPSSGEERGKSRSSSELTV
jgi:hypothetical protein